MARLMLANASHYCGGGVGIELERLCKPGKEEALEA